VTAAVTVVDYGSGNVFSVSRALEESGGRVTLSADPDAVVGAERLVLPGVGAFSAAMQALNDTGLADAVRRFVATGRPFLGICVGMQAMMDYSEEFGRHCGFGFIKGGVVAVPTTGADGTPHPVPHIGWNALAPGPGGWDGTPFAAVAPRTAVYFVHSFAAQPERPENVLATCDYDGRAITAAIVNDNVVGCQFHPEKSGPAGLAILAQFLTGATRR
jgi:glutamine amidotransferase